MVKKIRWGIMGWGKIAKKFAADLKLIDKAELVAIASFSHTNESDFPNDISVKYLHHNYEELANNKEVDIIYIATPHALHFDNCMLCLKNGKAVLCEKSFALDQKQALEMIETADKKKIFLMEAMWTKFLPHYIKLNELISEGKIGTIKFMSTQFGFIPIAPVADRIFNPKLGGGSLLDIGVYNVFLTLGLLGKPDSINAAIIRAPSGVDEQCAASFQYQQGAIAQLFSTFSSNLSTEANICGDKGRIKLTHRFFAPQTSIEYYSGGMETREEIEFKQYEGWGYHHEALHSMECLQSGLIESPVMKWSDTLSQLEVMDKIRENAGIDLK